MATGLRVGQSDPRSDFATLGASRPVAPRGAAVADVLSPTVRLTRRARGARVELSWSGRDRGRSGVASFAVQVREPGKEGYRTLLSRTARRRVTVRARRSGTYAFRVRATDAGGNVSRYVAARVAVR